MTNTRNELNNYEVDKLNPEVQQLVGDNNQSRLTDTLREAFVAARKAVSTNEPGALPVREVAVRNNKGEERYFDASEHVRGNGNFSVYYNAVDRDGTQINSSRFHTPALAPRVSLTVDEVQGRAFITASNAYELGLDGDLVSVTEPIAFEEVLRLLGPDSCGTRKDLTNNRHGVKSEGFARELQNALPQLMALKDGTNVHIGSVGRRKSYNVAVRPFSHDDGTTDSRIFFTDANDNTEFVISITIDQDNSLKQVSILEQDTLDIETGQYSGKEGIYPREALAIDNLASKVVRQFADAKKEEEPKPARRSIRDRLRDALNSRGTGTPDTYGISTNRAEAMIGETANAREVRELRATLNSVYSRPEVVTALESGSSEATINGVTLLIGPLQEPLNLDGATLPSAVRTIGISENPDPDTLLPLTGILESSDGQITSMTVAGTGDYEFTVYTPVANGPTRKDHHYRSDNGLLEERGSRLGARVRRFFKSRLGF